MNLPPNRASKSSGKLKKHTITIDLATARQMLPLVRSITADVVRLRQLINRLTPERERLDRHRHDLVWLERQRRYQVSDEINAAQANLQTALNELSVLGVVLTDEELGEIEFPSRINGRSAAFIWRTGDDAIHQWKYSGESQLRNIPADWSMIREIDDRESV